MFASVFALLGAEIDLEHAALGGYILVGNTEQRRQSLLAEITKYRFSGEMTCHDASQLAGRMNFAKTFVAGKTMIAPLHRVYERASGPKAKEKLGVELTAAMAMLFELLSEAAPRKVHLRDPGPNVVLYTDGAVESEGATCGAIIFPPGKQPEFFRMKIPKEWTDSWAAAGTRHAVAQAEAFPVLVAKLTWAHYLKEVNVLTFTDNEAIRAGLIKGYSPTMATYDILNAIGVTDFWADSTQWIARVPSTSNPADEPSRLAASEAIAVFGAVEVAPVVPALLASGRAQLSPAK